MSRFLAKGVVFAFTLTVVLSSSEALLTSTTAWRQYEDPRARILWDGAFDGTRVVLLGGSEFASMYVDAVRTGCLRASRRTVGSGCFRAP